MQLDEPHCSERRCRFFVGVEQIEAPGDPPFRHVPVCAAFPDGIPREIAYGRNKHLEPFPGDNGIQYEPAPAAE